ncbi:DUF2231 domain-containing protein [uncultured Jannaschia sp.]|uniref:DUF2231 domain-containing protein n=1 Tax=uncultured Jannaschia sp. TaxID=293347 RepID=UPI002606327D|nr:DUF2231 domain-containing protein [uncultured Jannaschia sp.]
MSTMHFDDGTGSERPSLRMVLLSFPIACFTLALLTDLAYWATANLLWQNFSAWLLFAGLVGGGLAVLAWIVWQVVARGRVVWSAVIANLLVLAAAFVNSLVHAGDGWTGVVPWGLALSAVTVLLMLVAGFLGATTIRDRSHRS